MATSCSCGSDFNFANQARGPGIQLVRVRIFQSVLILRAAYSIFHRQVLHWLHVERDSVDLCECGLQTIHHLGRIDLAFVKRFQIDQDASAVECCVRAVNTDKRRETLNRRIFENDLGQLPVASGPSREMKCSATLRRFPE